MPYRSTKCLSWSCCFTLHKVFTLLKGYTQMLPRCSTPVVCYDQLHGTLYLHFAYGISGMFLPLCRMVDGDVDGHFLLQLLCPHYLNLFQLDGY